MAETQAEAPVELPQRPGTVNHPSLKDTAAAYLREQILTGQLPPGTKIDQDEISEALGISRLPVREALIELAQESLIDAVPRRGAFVARLERADVIDHYRIFGLIAGLAGSRAATALSDEQLAHLRRIHESFVAATDPEDKAHWNHEFHRIINRAGGSRRLVSVLGLLSRSLPVRYFEFVPNWAAISNVATKTTAIAPDVIRPAALAISVPSLTDTTATIAWTATGDDSLTGTATTYDVRWSTAPITAANFASANAATGEPAPGASGAAQSFTVTGLSRQVTYYFAAKVADEAGNWSAMSNVPSATTPDTKSPAAISDLVVGLTWLNWSSVAVLPRRGGGR